MDSRHDRRERMERLEKQYEAAPGAYRVRLALWAALGYAVLATGLVVAAGLSITLFGLAIFRPLEDWRIVIPIVVLGMTAVILLRALWIRLGPPEGYPLGAGEAPLLREEVERIRREVGAQRLHGIIIDASLNAAAAYVPDGFGPLRQRHYLVIGLPLLQLLDRDELASVIAHEFGHFHGGHGRFGAWIYRLRVSWRRVLEGFSEPGFVSQQVFAWFFRWYAPRFEERSLVLARQQEYAADAMAATIAGAVPAASALARVHLASDWMERRFWPDVLRCAHAQSHPPAQVHHQLARSLADWRQRQGGLSAGVRRRRPEPDDTHPGLAQRFGALGVDPDMPLEPSGPAAAALLGDALIDRLEQRFSQQWLEEARPGWEARHRAAQEAERRLRSLEDASSRTPDEWLEYATLIEEHRPGTDAAPIYREGLRQQPSHAVGHGQLGILMLRQGQRDEGLEHLERAMRLMPSIAPSLLHELDDHLRATPEQDGLHAAAHRLHEAFDGEAGVRPAAEDDFQPHALEAGELQALCRVLAGHERVTSAWLVRRKAPGLSVLPHYLLLVEWAGSVAGEKAAIPHLTRQMTLPGTFTVSTTTGRSPQSRQLRARAGEPFYRR